MTRWTVLLMTCLGMFSYSISSVSEPSFEQQAIAERIKPVGKVRLTTDKTVNEPVSKSMSQPVKTVAEASGQTGKAIYTKYCTVCHASGLAGAPIAQKKSDWEVRGDKGIDALVETASKGVNAMPAKGTCMSCSTAELKSAIEYMLPKD